MSVKVKVEPECSCPEYEDLSPDSRMECRKQLDLEMKALEDKRKAFDAADAVDPMARTLLVVGLKNNRMPELSDFIDSFEELRERRGRYEGLGMPVFSGFQVFHERNWKFENGTWKQVDESFIRTRGVKEARFLLSLPHIDLIVRESGGFSGYRVRFVSATQDDETRKTFNVIHGLIGRLQIVSKELKEMEINCFTWETLPSLSDKYIDKAVFDRYMVDWERQRDAGDPLNCHSWAVLQNKVPVDIAELTKHMLELYKEECYTLMQLRKYQSVGLKFTF